VAKVQKKLETARVKLARQDSAIGQPNPSNSEFAATNKWVPVVHIFGPQHPFSLLKESP